MGLRLLLMPGGQQLDDLLFAIQLRGKEKGVLADDGKKRIIAILLPARLGGGIVAGKGFKLPGVHQIAQLLADGKNLIQ